MAGVASSRGGLPAEGLPEPALLHEEVRRLTHVHDHLCAARLGAARRESGAAALRQQAGRLEPAIRRLHLRLVEWEAQPEGVWQGDPVAKEQAHRDMESRLWALVEKRATLLLLAARADAAGKESSPAGVPAELRFRLWQSLVLWRHAKTHLDHERQWKAWSATLLGLVSGRRQALQDLAAALDEIRDTGTRLVGLLDELQRWCPEAPTALQRLQRRLLQDDALEHATLLECALWQSDGRMRTLSHDWPELAPYHYDRLWGRLLPEEQRPTLARGGDPSPGAATTGFARLRAHLVAGFRDGAGLERGTLTASTLQEDIQWVRQLVVDVLRLTRRVRGAPAPQGLAKRVLGERGPRTARP